jgi:hypothetical protein
MADFYLFFPHNDYRIFRSSHKKKKYKKNNTPLGSIADIMSSRFNVILLLTQTCSHLCFTGESRDFFSLIIS